MLCDELRPRPDGLDQLTGGTLGSRSDEWSDEEIGHDADLAGEWTTDDDT